MDLKAIEKSWAGHPSGVLQHCKILGFENQEALFDFLAKPLVLDAFHECNEHRPEEKRAYNSKVLRAAEGELSRVAKSLKASPKFHGPNPDKTDWDITDHKVYYILKIIQIGRRPGGMWRESEVNFEAWAHAALALYTFMVTAYTQAGTHQWYNIIRSLNQNHSNPAASSQRRRSVGQLPSLVKTSSPIKQPAKKLVQKDKNTTSTPTGPVINTTPAIADKYTDTPSARVSANITKPSKAIVAGEELAQPTLSENRGSLEEGGKSVKKLKPITPGQRLYDEFCSTFPVYKASYNQFAAHLLISIIHCPKSQTYDKFLLAIADFEVVFRQANAVERPTFANWFKATEKEKLHQSSEHQADVLTDDTIWDAVSNDKELLRETMARWDSYEQAVEFYNQNPGLRMLR